MVKEKNAIFLFLMETISCRKKMEWIRVKLSYEGLFVVEPVGRSGGLVLLCKKVNDLEIQNLIKVPHKCCSQVGEGG